MAVISSVDIHSLDGRECLSQRLVSIGSDRVVSQVQNGQSRVGLGCLSQRRTQFGLDELLVNFMQATFELFEKTVDTKGMRLPRCISVHTMSNRV